MTAIRFDYLFQTPSCGLLEEKWISFNVRRPRNTLTPFPRKVTLLFHSHLKSAIIPGIREPSERLLVKELQAYHKWKMVKEHSFEIGHHLYSLLWKFNKSHEFVARSVRDWNPLVEKDAKKTKNIFNRHKSFLSASLHPGQIYLFPDSDVIFHDPDRYKQPYARKVLILDVSRDDLIFIPFTKQLHRLNPVTDVLFDTHFEGLRLDPESKPPIENFPYMIFPQKAVLCVSAAQPMAVDDFLNSALAPLGSVSRDVLGFVKNRMKEL